jgi:hypothetical protein
MDECVLFLSWRCAIARVRGAKCAKLVGSERICWKTWGRAVKRDIADSGDSRSARVVEWFTVRPWRVASGSWQHCGREGFLSESTLLS